MREPRAAQAHFMRGVQLLRGGQTAAATASLLAAVRADDSHFEAHRALGAALAQGGRFAESARVLERAVALQPGSPAAHAALGGAYDNQGLHEAAIAAFGRAVELRPDLGAVHHRLAALHSLYSHNEAAADCLDRAADAAPASPEARLYRSDAAGLRGDFAGAERVAREAVALEPSSPAAHGTLGGVLYAQGRFDLAAAAFEAALALDPKLAKSWDGLVHCRTWSNRDSPLVERLGAVLRRSDLTEGERTTMQFALGKLLDDRGDFAAAMAAFDEGNRLRGRHLAFDRAAFAAGLDRAIAAFTPEAFARAAPFAVADERPLIIVGMYRSGTTLVERILSSHPSIAGGGELTVWRPGEMEAEAATGRFDPEAARPSAARYLARLESLAPEAARVTDKLPFNFLRLGGVHALMPGARIVHCRRDPIDTCLSIHTTLFNTRVAFAARQADLVFVYRQYQRMMAHWRAVLPAERFIEVDYERLVASPEAETRRLIAFADVGWDDRCLRPESNPRPIATASAWQARQPIHARATQRWRRYEPWLGELRELAKGEAG